MKVDDLIVDLQNMNIDLLTYNESYNILINWRVFVVYDHDVRSTHIIGFNGSDCVVTDDVLEFNPKDRTVKTVSGLTYILQGKSSYIKNVIMCFDKWLGNIGAPEVEDITYCYELEV